MLPVRLHRPFVRSDWPGALGAHAVNRGATHIGARQLSTIDRVVWLPAELAARVRRAELAKGSSMVSDGT